MPILHQDGEQPPEHCRPWEHLFAFSRQTAVSSLGLGPTRTLFASNPPQDMKVLGIARATWRFLLHLCSARITLGQHYLTS